MNLFSIPDIAGMLVLMGVLAWLRERYRDSTVDLWMLGLTFILIESFAAAFFGGSHLLDRVGHVVAMQAYVLAAVTFGWAAREDRLFGPMRLPLLLPPAAPIFFLATLYGAGVAVSRWYLAVAVTAVFVGFVYIVFLLRARRIFRSALLAIHFAIWIPITAMAYQGRVRGLVYWGLGCFYLIVALSFRRRARCDGIGGFVIVAGFVIWALCFFIHPSLRGDAYFNRLLDQVATMQKFFVVIGMLLALLERQTRRREDEAMHDVLTGLPNRRLFDDRLSQALDRARRTGRSTAVFIIDLNGFKQINDTCGHSTGDTILRSAGCALKVKIRSSDTLARWGGDEFSVIVNDIQRREDCERIAETMRRAVASVVIPSDCADPLTGSVGFALFPQDADGPATLCQLADRRMYDEKKAGVRTLALVP